MKREVHLHIYSLNITLTSPLGNVGFGVQAGLISISQTECSET